MTIKKDVYDDLAELIGAPGSASFIKILEVLITPEDGKLVLELPVPATSQELAKRLNMSEGSLHVKLDELVTKRWLRSTRDGYVAPLMNPRFMPRALLPGISESRFEELSKEFYYADYRRILVENRERMLAVKGYNSQRIVPASKALAMSPNIRPQQILPYEDFQNMLNRATDITVHECGCRTHRAVCNRPVETCIRMSWTGEVQIWRGDGSVPQAQYEKTVGHSEGTHITRERAMEVFDQAEEAGLVHVLENTSRLQGGMCNCCPCCCYILDPGIHFGKVHKMLAPSRYQAVIDETLCNGCQTCVERCYFDAIEMRKPSNSKKLKAYMINENCMGCGLCVFKCPSLAMHLEVVRPPSHIPNLPMSEVTSLQKF